MVNRNVRRFENNSLHLFIFTSDIDGTHILHNPMQLYYIHTYIMQYGGLGR